MGDDKTTSYAPFVDFEVKADGDNGIVDGYASVFEHRDHSKDRVMPGAFTKTLAERGKYIVYLPSHDYKIHVKDIPGVPLAIREDSKGLFTSTKFFLNTQAGKDSFNVIKEYQEAGRALGLSFTFRPTAKGAKFTSKGRDLSEVELFEYGHTPLPMHDMSRTVSAKADHTNSMMHSEEVDHLHHHGETVHSHGHVHDTKNGMYYGSSHDYHDHSADQVKSLVDSTTEYPHYWAEIDEAELTKMVDAKVAMESKTFPINDETQLASALEEFEEGRVVETQRSNVREHIIARAKSLGQTELLPDEWLGGSKILLYLPYVDTKDDSLLSEFESMIGHKLVEEESAKFRAALAAMDDIKLLTQKEDDEAKQTKEELEAKRKEKDEIEAALARVRI